MIIKLQYQQFYGNRLIHILVDMLTSIIDVDYKIIIFE